GDRQLTRRQCPPKGLPADQRAPKRQERLVDVGPFVVADAPPAKLIQPRKCPFHYPAPTSQAAAVPRSTLGQQRVNVTGAQTVTDRLRVIRTIAEDAVRTAPYNRHLTHRNLWDSRAARASVPTKSSRCSAPAAWVSAAGTLLGGDTRRSHRARTDSRR